MTTLTLARLLLEAAQRDGDREVSIAAYPPGMLVQQYHTVVGVEPSDSSALMMIRIEPRA